MESPVIRGKRVLSMFNGDDHPLSRASRSARSRGQGCLHDARSRRARRALTAGRIEPPDATRRSRLARSRCSRTLGRHAALRRPLGTRAAAEDITLAVGAVFGGRPHRIVYRSALDWHGLLEHPSRRIVLAVDKRPGLRELSGRPLRLVLEQAEQIELAAIDAGHQARLVTRASAPRIRGAASGCRRSHGCGNRVGEGPAGCRRPRRTRAIARSTERLSSAWVARRDARTSSSSRATHPAVEHRPSDPTRPDTHQRRRRVARREMGSRLAVRGLELEETVRR